LRAACLARDGWRCQVPGCCAVAQVADHIVARPFVPFPCEQDTLANLRSLCRSHDAQVKERRRGVAIRKQGGAFKVKGCDEDGWPLDPSRRR